MQRQCGSPARETFKHLAQKSPPHRHTVFSVYQVYHSVLTQHEHTCIAMEKCERYLIRPTCLVLLSFNLIGLLLNFPPSYLGEFSLDGERLGARLCQSVLDVPRGRRLQLLPQEQQVVLPPRVLRGVLVQFLQLFCQ